MAHRPATAKARLQDPHAGRALGELGEVPAKNKQDRRRSSVFHDKLINQA